jgi:hypothetical protein
MPGMVRFSSLENLLCQVEFFGVSHTWLCHGPSFLQPASFHFCLLFDQQAFPFPFGFVGGQGPTCCPRSHRSLPYTSTVAILAQGTPRAVAVTQAFFDISRHSSPALGPFPSKPFGAPLSIPCSRSWSLPKGSTSGQWGSGRSSAQCSFGFPSGIIR